MKTIVRLDPTAHAATLASVPADSIVRGTTRDLEDLPGSWSARLAYVGVMVSPLQFLYVPLTVRNKESDHWLLVVMPAQLFEFGFEFDHEQKLMHRGDDKLYAYQAGLHLIGYFTKDDVPDDRAEFYVNETLYIS
ncbi:hypothetical protein HDU86_002974 [Geranomyces michiganensis]|nr:hypothetical protein HDU86_002974 [Geranomyces michiganensis]